ncbi:MAG: hypothetical protein AAGK37_15490 [Pseudomonadota bacterium]
MANEWMMDVLADLRQFADQNDMPRLAAELSHARAVACDEIRAAASRKAEGVLCDEGVGGTLPGRVVASQDA